MDKPLLEWQRRLRGMDEATLLEAWKKKSKDDGAWTREPGWFAVVAARMKQLGNMGIDLDDDTRKTLCRTAIEIINRLEHQLADARAPLLNEIRDLHSERDEFDQKFGTKTARYYMYEQGIIDVLGDKQPFSAR
ncbi:hypothetical protein [Ahrensia sp. R2A130]|uniref:hypothetical protein n=1 Tax=Ahrensia sp. R2A130 TaxID=744979 RepID=UPI0001E0E068|nr:hypothetical protein [Ahrensia sp. R2A130]EFL90371.1 conserved hypothetical protein [Ahrensia sp. R2A130]